MSSRKERDSHNIFQDTEQDKEPKYDPNVDQNYADNEDMTIPKFHNRVAKDSGWSQRTDTR